MILLLFSGSEVVAIVITQTLPALEQNIDIRISPLEWLVESGGGWSVSDSGEWPGDSGSSWAAEHGSGWAASRGTEWEVR